MNAAADFDGERPRLLALAYRMTGSRADAEDLVQEAYARLAVAADVQAPAAWLTTVTSRLAIDHLRLARVQREEYVGPWVPEPAADVVGGPEEDAVLAETVSGAMLVVLETMSPLERAVFVLHDVFGYAFDEVAAMVERTPASVRQTARRARQHVDARRPRFSADPDRRRAAGERFVAAARGQDLAALMEVLSPDVTFRSDGGGVVVAARKVLHGADRVVRFLASLAEGAPGWTLEPAWLNAGPAVWLRSPDGRRETLLLLQVGPDGRIAEINAQRNPAKLSGLLSEPDG